LVAEDLLYFTIISELSISESPIINLRAGDGSLFVQLYTTP